MKRILLYGSFVKDKLFPGSRQGLMYDKLLKKLGMTKCVIRERGNSYFLSAYVATV